MNKYSLLNQRIASAINRNHLEVETNTETELDINLFENGAFMLNLYLEFTFVEGHSYRENDYMNGTGQEVVTVEDRVCIYVCKLYDEIGTGVLLDFKMNDQLNESINTLICKLRG